MIALVFLVFFVMSLLTNILGPLVPDIISDFRVSLAAAAVLPFSFFIAYGVMSIPAGFWVERFTEKPVMIVAFLAGTIGSLSFALLPSYSVAVVSLFVMGAGMATLQTAINPLLRVAGGEENFAFNSAFAQLIFGSASFLSPQIYSYLVENLDKPSASNLLLRLLRKLTPVGLPWASMYWIFAVCTLFMVVVLFLSQFPKVQHTGDEAASSQAGSLAVLYLCVCLRRFRAGNGRLDFTISFPVSRLRSAYHRGNRRLLVLGAPHSGLLYWNVTAESV